MDAAIRDLVVEALWDAFCKSASETWRHIETEGHYAASGRFLRERPCTDPDTHLRLLRDEALAWQSYCAAKLQDGAKS